MSPEEASSINALEHLASYVGSYAMTDFWNSSRPERNAPNHIVSRTPVPNYGGMTPLEKVKAQRNYNLAT